MSTPSSRFPIVSGACRALTRPLPRWLTVLCAGLLLVIPVVGSGSPPASPDAEPAASARAEDGEGNEGRLGRIKQDVEDSEYHVRFGPRPKLAGVSAGWQAPNRAHNFRTYFTAGGVRVIPRTEEEPSWEWGLSLLGYGRGRDVRPVKSATLTPAQKRVEYLRGRVAEWYINDRRGIEQGFTLAVPPEEVPPRRPSHAAFVPGARRQGSPESAEPGPAFVVLKLTGTLSPTISADGQAIDFTTPSGGMSVLHYARLAVHDATGRELPAWMEGFAEAGMRGIRLVFEDADAVYPVTVDPLATSPAWTAEGDQAGAQLGISVAAAGDVNNDTFDDVIVGAPHYDVPGLVDGGRVFVYHGSASGLGTTPAWTVESSSPPWDTVTNPIVTIRLGQSVAAAGDVNGDGIDDVIIGARGTEYATGIYNEGWVFVFHGSYPGGLKDCGAPGPGQPCTPADADWKAMGDVDGAILGQSVAGAGDVNGDDVDDVIVGGIGLNGTAFVFHGSGSGLITDCGGATCTSAHADWSMEGDQASWGIGYLVSTAGDVNGDTYDDVIIAARTYDNVETDEGAIFVFHGSSSGLKDCGAPCTPMTDHDWHAEGELADIQFGQSATTAGDVNGDGFADVIVGAHNDPSVSGPGNKKGAAFVFHGSLSGLDVGPSGYRESGSPSNADWSIKGDQQLANVGFAAAGAGDVNGDGYGDVIVGAPRYDAGGLNEGRVHVYEGSPSGLPTTQAWVWRADGDSFNAWFGYSVAGVGDVNGDGFGDVMVGAPYYSRGQDEEGRAIVYHGAPTVTGWTLANRLGLAPQEIGSVSWEVNPDAAGSNPLSNNETPDAVTSGPVPESVLITTGRATQGSATADYPERYTGIADVDWGGDGQPDVTTFELVLNIPPWAGTLRFTTQYLTNEVGAVFGDPFDEDSARFRFRLNGWSVTDYPLDDLARWVVNSPVSHCINVAGRASITLRFTVEDKGGSDVMYEDSGLLLSRVFFSQLPFPPDITLQNDGVDGDEDGVVDYFVNPAPSDVSLSTGTYAYTKSLFSIPGISMPFSFAIIYNSQADRAGSLGRKWTHSYLGYAEEIKTDENDDGTPETLQAVLIRHGSGTAEYFEPDGPVGYRPKHPGVYSKLTGTSGSYTVVTKSHLTYEFTEQDFTEENDARDVWLLTRVTGPNGNAFNDPNDPNAFILNYNTGNDPKKVSSVVDTRGQTINFEYTNDRLSAVTYDWQTNDVPPKPVTSRITLGYDASTNDLASLTDLNGNTTTFTYDDFGNLLTVTDADDVTVVANSYEQYQGINLLQVGDRVVSRRNGNDPDPFDPDAGASFEYDGEAMTQTDRLDPPRRDNRLHDVKGRLARRIDPTGVQWEFSYDRHGNTTEELRRLPSENGSRTTAAMQYDDSGNLLSRSDFPGICIGGAKQGEPCGSGCQDSTCGIQSQSTYDAHDNRLTTTDHEGNTTSFTYDANHNQLSATDPLGNVTTNTYDSAGRVVSTTDARGFTYFSVYDSAIAEPTEVYNPVDADGDGWLDSVSYTYDDLGRRIKVKDPNGNTTKSEYDDAGQLLAETDALGNRTEYTYDAAGRQLTIREPNGAVSRSSYSPTGKVLQTTDPLGNTNQYEYDAEDRLVLLEGPLGRITTYEYDAGDRLTRVRACDAGQTTCFEAVATYDESGNLTRVTDPRGNNTEYEYDLMGRITRETDHDGNSVSYTYDGRGLVSSKTNARGQTQTYEYDAAGRLTRVDLLPGGWITHTLDANGNPELSLSNQFASVSRVFDPLDRLVERVDAFGNRVGYRYDPAGNLVELTYPTDADSDGNRDAVAYTYDQLNRLKTVTDWNGKTTTYTSDSTGNLTGAALPDSSSVTYTYDLAHRLTGIQDPNASFVADYTLDAAGQRIAADVTLPLPPAITPGVDTFTHNALNQPDGYTYDADGNMTSGVIGGALMSLEYNALSQLVRAGDDTFRYDVDGLRVETTGAGTTRRFVHDPATGLSRLLEEHDGAGNLVARYVHGLGLISREEASGTFSVYHFDSRGSTVALTNDAGVITDKYAYGPYGAVTRDAANPTDNPFTYNGRDGVYDDENGLYYMRARYYAPSLMRFIQKDLIFEGVLSDTQSLNRHAFVQGNPILLVDPSGEIPNFIVGAIIGGVVSGTMECIVGDCKKEFWKDRNFWAAFVEGAISGAVSGNVISIQQKGWISGIDEIVVVGAGLGGFGGLLGGGVGAMIRGDDIGYGMGAGFVGGALGGAVGGLVPVKTDFLRAVSSSTGAFVGTVTSSQTRKWLHRQREKECEWYEDRGYGDHSTRKPPPYC